MTTLVRIENADVAADLVIVQVYDRGTAGAPDTLAHEVPLDHQTFMANLDIHSGLYLVVTEEPLSPPTP